jgi:hypothetical protein
MIIAIYDTIVTLYAQFTVHLENPLAHAIFMLFPVILLLKKYVLYFDESKQGIFKLTLIRNAVLFLEEVAYIEPTGRWIHSYNTERRSVMADILLTGGSRLLAVIAIRYFFDKHPLPDDLPLIYNPLDDPVYALQLVGLFICLFITMDFFISLLLVVPVSLVFKRPYRPMFRNPLLSTSLREMWSARWNLIVKDVLHKAVFTIIVKNLQMSPVFASVMTFFMSALYHEIIAFTILEEFSWLNLLFFTLHGFICVIESFVPRPYLIPAKLWRSLGWFYVLVVFLFTGPLFMNPFVRIIRSHLFTVVPYNLLSLNLY